MSSVDILCAHTSIVRCLLQLDNQRIASGSGDGSISIWDFNRGIRLHNLVGHQSIVSGLTLLENNVLVSLSGDTTVRFWSLENYSTTIARNYYTFLDVSEEQINQTMLNIEDSFCATFF